MRGRLAMLVALLSGLPLPAAHAALSGELVYTEGDVMLRRGGQTTEAQIGDEIGAGDVVVTGAKSLAVVDLSNNTTLKLREKTTIAVDSLGNATSVSLTTGGAFISIAGKLTGTFSLKAQGTVAGVRGTEFFVAYGRSIDQMPDLWLCVNQGAVDVALPAKGQSVLVEAGRGINIVGGEKLTVPRRYPWTRKLNWNNDPSAGRVADETDLEQAYSDLLDQDYD